MLDMLAQRLGMSVSGSLVCHGQLLAMRSQQDPPRLGGSERCFGAAGYLLPLVFRNRRENMNDKSVGEWGVGGTEIDAAIKEGCNVGHVTRQPVQLRYDQSGLEFPACCQGSVQYRAVADLSGFNLHVFFEQDTTGLIDKSCDGFSLRF